MRRMFLLLTLLTSLSLHAQTPKPPNIIFIITDDQGYGDISAHGNPILKTPHLDRLHRESVRFTDFHVSPTCAPTRAALLTGRHEFKNGVTHTIHERERLTLDATTLPQILKTAGYTTGIFGKWHLGDEAPYRPDQRGFDETFIHGAGGIGQSYPGSCGDAPGNTYFDPLILHNNTFVKTSGYCTDVFFTQALTWIKQASETETPFYCHIATNTPHTPLDARPEDEARYTGKLPPNPAEGKGKGKGPFAQPGATEKFFGMVANIDDNIGILLQKLAEWDLERDTLVIFMNDNGGTGGVRIHNANMRGQKGTPWLGGTRAASFWRWPGTLTPADVPALTAHIDFLPTLIDITHAKPDSKTLAQIEGRSLLPLLKNSQSEWPDRTLITHVGRWEQGTNPDTGKYTNVSIRTPEWQLIQPTKINQPNWQLYQVKSDPSQTIDVAAQHPDIVKALAAQYETWWQQTLPLMVNENVPLAPANPFKLLYEKQFGPASLPE
ncbi:arylsulfatase [Phragmitibacter flavus]|uniref:Arylsulfatase n=2 Tax=Phragmitibacter flavus TaxID=2576071 RepID=A0A5R8KAY1_9BACT|nr:arylsulfatase [Phragmitibacter flavus]TLD68699.1 arylsulfatase [Phragmitibacter flavus]